LKQAHASEFDGARVEYAMVLTKHICFNQLKKKLFPTDEERAENGVRLRTTDDFRQIIRAHYEAMRDGS